RDALQLMATELPKPNARVQQRRRGRRDPHLVGARRRHHTCCDMYGQAADVSRDLVVFTRMASDPYAHPKRPGSGHQHLPAPDGPCGTVEDREQAVARRGDLPAAKVLEVSPNRAVEVREERVPRGVTHMRRGLGRGDDVGEENRPERPTTRIGVAGAEVAPTE